MTQHDEADVSNWVATVKLAEVLRTEGVPEAGSSSDCQQQTEN